MSLNLTVGRHQGPDRSPGILPRETRQLFQTKTGNPKARRLLEFLSKIGNSEARRLLEFLSKIGNSEARRLLRRKLPGSPNFIQDPGLQYPGNPRFEHPLNVRLRSRRRSKLLSEDHRSERILLRDTGPERFQSE